MHSVKCKDYLIIKIRSYADEVILKKWIDEGFVGAMPQQHWERAKEYTSFIWKMIEYVTGKTTQYWCTEYILEGRQCALDSIEETHGILYSTGEGWETVMIPKKHTQIITWIKDNIKLPYKTLLKTNLGYLGRKHDLQWRRARAKEFTKEMKEKHSLK